MKAGLARPESLRARLLPSPSKATRKHPQHGLHAAAVPRLPRGVQVFQRGSTTRPEAGSETSSLVKQLLLLLLPTSQSQDVWCRGCSLPQRDPALRARSRLSRAAQRHQQQQQGSFVAVRSNLAAHTSTQATRLNLFLCFAPVCSPQPWGSQEFVSLQS